MTAALSLTPPTPTRDPPRPAANTPPLAYTTSPSAHPPHLLPSPHPSLCHLAQIRRNPIFGPHAPARTHLQRYPATRLNGTQPALAGNVTTGLPSAADRSSCPPGERIYTLRRGSQLCPLGERNLWLYLPVRIAGFPSQGTCGWAARRRCVCVARVIFLRISDDRGCSL